MKSRLWIVVFISCLTFASCEKESNPGQQIYFNSFESQSDITGWSGSAIDFSNDVPDHGGKKSLAVSGGCLFPHAQYTVSPQNSDCYLILKFRGKNLSNGGSVYLYVNGSARGEVSFDVSDKKWTLYESRDTLFCPANTGLTLGVSAGGIYSSTILVDMIEIRRIN